MTRSFVGFAFASVFVMACGSDDDGSSGSGGSSSSAATSTTSAANGGVTSSTGAATSATNGPATGAGGGGPSGAGSGGSTAMGACTNDADIAILTSKDVEAIVGQCGQENLGAEPDTKDCIKMQTGLSDPCVACFDETVACAVDQCFNQCIGDENSPDCQMCVDQNCTPAFETCSGVMAP